VYRIKPADAFARRLNGKVQPFGLGELDRDRSRRPVRASRRNPVHERKLTPAQFPAHDAPVRALDLPQDDAEIALACQRHAAPS